MAAANATEFGLTASVWSADEALADRVAEQLVAGTVSINCHGMAAQDPRLPFGGARQSGLGRELGSRASGPLPSRGCSCANRCPGSRSGIRPQMNPV
ncbi:aldehyde dehydrogenase family protein [Mycobacterium xenopi 4042]|uniref:Putative succinate-semialdehyde dehydrogenase [NADP(+)] 2 n=1 Tax=Mycobacterium xenopi 4042 TaxID=1299334 RepID=X8DB67_MYCXE|nr:aldehyde dehydrogenase family protein [Mycobacterium xenopi 4042]